MSENEAKALARQWGDGSVGRSIVLYLEASAEWKKIGQPIRAAASLREAGRLYLSTSDYVKSKVVLENAAELERKANNNEGMVLTLAILSHLANQRGDASSSEKAYKRALTIARRSTSDLAKAVATLSEAEFGSLYGNLEATLELYEAGRQLAEKAQDNELLAAALIDFGYAYARIRNPADALPHMQQAMSISQQIGDKRGEAMASIGIAFLFSLMRENQNALRHYRRAESMFPTDADWLEKAKVLNGIATIYDGYGDAGLAEEYRKRALKLYEQADYPYGQLATLISLARTSHIKGDRVASEIQFKQALEIAYRLNDRFHLAVINENFGHLYLRDGNYGKALTSFQKAQSEYKALGVVLPRVDNNLGKAFEGQGKFEVARGLYDAALETNRKIKDLTSESENLFNLARLSSKVGQNDLAIRQIKESLAITDSVYYATGNENLKRNFLSSVFDRWELYITLLMHNRRETLDERSKVEALQAVEKSRARLVLENLSRIEPTTLGDADPALIAKERQLGKQLNSKADELTDLLKRNAEKSKIDKLQTDVDELSVELDGIRAELRETSPIYSAIRAPESFNVQKFQEEVLDDRTLCLEFFFGESESYLWIISKSAISSHILPPRRVFENRIQTLRDSLAPSKIQVGESIESYQAKVTDKKRLFEQEAILLSRDLLGPISKQLHGKRIIIIPDGTLSYFPVAALPVPDNELFVPILQTNEITYAPSAAILQHLATTASRPDPQKDLLVISDPVYSETDIRLTVGKSSKPPQVAGAELKETFRSVETLDSLERLKGSFEEGNAVASIVGNSRSQILTGFAANRENIKQVEFRDYRIVHFATHGLIDEGRPELSGLVLSRFDENRERLSEIIRLQDIYGMTLFSDLVVLSACNTGIGKEVRGQGLMSLNTAFLQVGSRSVVSSLWKVDDLASKELMTNFYRNLSEKNLGVSEALRQAQLKLLSTEQYRSPFHWAAFIAHGDFRPPVRTAKSWSGRLWILPLIGLLLLAGYRLVGQRLFKRKFVQES